MTPCAGNSKMVDNNQVLKRKRKSLPSGRSISNANKKVSLASESLGVKNDSNFGVPSSMIGEDGYYFECVICDNGGDLLCCDTCPCTYHLQCLSPPLECVPPGNWQCPNCCEKDDHSRPIIHLRSPNAKKNTSSSKEKHSSSDVSSSLESNKKLDLSTDATAGSVSSSCVNKTLHADSSHPLHKLGEVASLVGKTTALEEFVHGEKQQYSVNFTDDGKGTENDILNSIRANQSIESNAKSIEEQVRARVHHTMNGDACMQTPKRTELDKLLILSHFDINILKQNNNEERDLPEETSPRHTQKRRAHKEKFAALRARQKKRLALRNTSRGPCSNSGLPGCWDLIQFHKDKSSETTRFHASANNLNDQLLPKQIMTRDRETGVQNWLDRSLDHRFHSVSSCSQDLSTGSHFRSPYYSQSKFKEQLPDFASHIAPHAGCSTSRNMNNQKIAIPDSSSYIQFPRTVPPDYSSKSSASDFMSGFSFRQNVDNNIMRAWSGSNNLRKNRAMANAWSEEELDCLWMGVRRYGQGNWETMLRDPTLNFSKDKTPEDLSERWNKERLNFLNSQGLPAQKPTSSLHSTISNGVMSQISKECRYGHVMTDCLQCPKNQTHVTDAQVHCAHATDQSFVLTYSPSSLKLDNSTSNKLDPTPKILRHWFQEPVCASEWQLLAVLEPRTQPKTTNVRDHEKKNKMPMPSQASPAIAKSRKNFHMGCSMVTPNFSSMSFKNQLPLHRKKKAKQNLLLGGTFPLPKFGVDLNESNDSSQTESDTSQRCEGNELSSEGTLSV
uniref:PHD-type domain-containing protein n=1 Tax=Fagus sylvatica TaxID=28930 RepID=A0A2N9IYW3_FAGSY